MTKTIVRMFSCACVLAAAVVLAADQPKAAQAPAQPALKKAASAAGAMVVVKDAETGQIRQAEAGEIGALLKQGPPLALATAGEPATFPGPRGSIGMDVPEDLMMYSVATKGPDGKIRLESVTGRQAAAQAVSKPAPKKEALDEK